MSSKKAATVSPDQLSREANIPRAAVYRGRVYVRPVERGVVLRDAGTGEFEMYLDNFAALVGLGDKFRAARGDGGSSHQASRKTLD